MRLNNERRFHLSFLAAEVEKHTHTINHQKTKLHIPILLGTQRWKR